jgi:putative aldouronate transport system substrate-binding protein
MKASKGTLVSSLLVASLFVVTACSGGGSETAEETPAPANGETETAGEPAAAPPEEPALTEEDYFRFKEPVNVVFGKSVNDIKVYPEGEDPQNNAVYAMMKDTANIVGTNKFAVPFDTYLQQLKLGIASNEIPDIFYADQATLEELIRNDMLVDMKPIYDKYATENTKKIMGYDDGVLFKGAQRGEAIYGLPSVSDALNGSPVVYIRKDWLEKLGASTPTTLEELLDLAVRFTKEDPDGNGQNDTYGLSMNNQLDLRFTAILNAYGVYPKIYQTGADGKMTYGSLNPGMKQGLTALADLYKQGAIEPEFVTKDMPKSMEIVSKGSVGILLGEFFSPLWPLQDVPKNVPGADFVSIPMPGLGGAEYKPYVPINASGYFVVRKGFEHPEALMLMLNNMSETAYSNLENPWAKAWADLSKDPKYAAAGINNWLPVFFDRPDANTNRYNLYKYALDNNDDTKMPEDQRNTFNLVKAGLDGDPNNWPWPRTFLEGVPNASSYKTVIRNEWFGSPTETAKQKGASLTKLEEETLIKIIVGQQPVDSFDAFANEWLAGGGQDILNEMTAAIAAQ